MFCIGIGKRQQEPRVCPTRFSHSSDSHPPCQVQTPCILLTTYNATHPPTNQPTLSPTHHKKKINKSGQNRKMERKKLARSEPVRQQMQDFFLGLSMYVLIGGLPSDSRNRRRISRFHRPHPKVRPKLFEPVFCRIHPLRGLFYCV